MLFLTASKTKKYLVINLINWICENLHKTLHLTCAGLFGLYKLKPWLHSLITSRENVDKNLNSFDFRFPFSEIRIVKFTLRVEMSSYT